jgi:uncharacterized membrane protein
MFMKTRQEIKAIAKQNFSANYWVCVGATVLAFVVIGAASGVSSFVGGLGALFVAPHMMVGLQYFTLLIYRDSQPTPTIEDMFKTGFSDYGRKLGGMLWMYLFIYLWSMLLVVPGIIKAIAYSFTPYILAEYPNVSATEALKISMRMTKGHKGKIFMMSLSFFGWFLLSGFTLGLVGIFFANPYFYTATAGLYDELKQVALAEGTVTLTELQ